MKHALRPAAAALVIVGVAAIGCDGTTSLTERPRIIPMPRPVAPELAVTMLVSPTPPVPSPLPESKPEPSPASSTESSTKSSTKSSTGSSTGPT
ncbi:hypothetical protein HD597_001347 [Nonomuraea thailandensis]|uniref:Uncharacterized protein n=1 Tax=Nonomuraea thailandensis TaxID=1188745 RepID=A0A9X2GAX7_9ACTN|nr:hypothetical protein [Nonomuraea thailandensis]MCP2354327.1 hypothetical protein [Nonomuraea thailandensis]